MTGICIECAVRYHDFQEIPCLPHADDPIGRILPEAWIDGKRYKLGWTAHFHVSCDHCHRVTGSLFTPEDRNRPCA